MNNINKSNVYSYTPGLSGCGCGSRRYYTKAEIDAMLANVLDEDKIKEILDQMFEEYIEEGDLYELILNVIGDIYTKDEIDAMFAALDAGKLDTTAFTQFKNEMENCCSEVNDKIDELEVIIANLQEQIDNITGGTTPDTGDTPDTGTTPDTGDTPTPDNRPRVITRFNVTSTTEPTQILYAIGDNLSDIKDGNGNQIPVSLYYTFPSLGEQTLIFYYKKGIFTDRQQWYGLTQITFAQQIGVTAGSKAFENSSLAYLRTRNGASYAYRNCKNLTSLDLGVGWGSVATEVFNGCSSLVMDFVISEEGTKIGNGAFKGTRIRTLTIPQTVTTIYGTCLNGCTEMQYVRFLGTTPPETIKDGAFSNGTYPIYVPSSAVNTYKTKLPAYASRIQAWNG